MTLVDAGALIALINRTDPDHKPCAGALTRARKPLVTTWPALGEAMHLVGAVGGWRGQSLLWELALSPDLVLHDLDQAVTQRMATLMEKYQDLPMDLADASLVALAEARGISQIVTLDSDFAVYRLHGRKAFRILP